MARYEQVIQVVAAVEQDMSTGASVMTVVVMVATLVVVAALLAIATWRNKKS